MTERALTIEWQMIPKFRSGELRIVTIPVTDPRNPMAGDYSVGDRFWIRQDFQKDPEDNIRYRDTPEGNHWTPAVFMGRADSPFSLEITYVDAEARKDGWYWVLGVRPVTRPAR